MTQPYRYAPYTVQYRPLVDEIALGVRRSQRRAGLSTLSGKPRAIYGARKTPFADDIVVGIYRLHREGRIDSVNKCSLGRWNPMVYAEPGGYLRASIP